MGHYWTFEMILSEIRRNTGPAKRKYTHVAGFKPAQRSEPVGDAPSHIIFRQRIGAYSPSLSPTFRETPAKPLKPPFIAPPTWHAKRSATGIPGFNVRSPI